ncbi:MAG: RNB domain-containing ribonuclease, partial [Candidatus Nanohaloarchaea archaeon]|nr:RNB domain-containing ribonuclease [Candidatus Nanohaloarchaea archaeon]
MTGRDGAGAAYGAWDGEVSHDSGVTRLREVVSAEDREEVEAVVGQYLHIDRAVDYATRQLGRQPEPGRVDRRDARTYLIDDPGSRAEDAITVQQTMDGGYDLEMHIIDIPFLLEPGGYVDRHAAARGRTVYSDDGVHPLFPGELRDGPFCFRAGADRPANTVRFRFDSAVDLVDVSVYRSAVQPDTRLSFDEAADLLHRSKTDVGRGEADCITDLEHLKVATLSLVDELPWEPESPWSM